MDIRILVKANEGIPFYNLDNGDFFHWLEFNTSGSLCTEDEYLANNIIVYRKYDKEGYILYPHDSISFPKVRYINPLTIVKMITEDNIIYKNFKVNYWRF